MSRERRKEKADKAHAEEEASKSAGQTPSSILPALTFDEYQCSGDVEADFPGLCALLDVKDIPTVITRQPASSTTDTEGASEDSESKSNAAPPWSTPCLQVELENEDPLSAKKLKISGWKVDEQISRVIQKMFPSLSKLQSLQCWQAGLTDRMVASLMDTVSLCSNLRAVTLEGNHLPERSYHLLLSEDSVLTHLSLRNNRMGDEGARLIGSALSTTKSANKNLLSLNLAFNSIGDAGATHIAQGLRYNRGLLVLSLGNNHIGDSGAAHLAAILGEFALTHEEVVERRKMLLERTHSVDAEPPADRPPSVARSSSLGKGENKGKKRETSKKDEKPAASKENPKSKKKSSYIRTQSKGGKHGGQEKPQNAQEVPESRFLKRFKDRSSPALTEPGESVEILNPLLDQPVQYRDGELFLPGNQTLASLDLAGNRITKKSLPLFLTSLEMQAEGGGLLRLCLQISDLSFRETASHQIVSIM
ncbi:leucine-rich repeat-containing protein 71 isoform X2 [Pseudoliparis swirei]|uniref:leucine-rich repeat-containing protein 71 isoform X2 n=1 Tax=Pseudoliparis swirei TaxID=2059687 RepID=UPI0024BEDFF7|nr:leucine-rich repeat-containing protein 71 isoform X2 [Pseudoliparis swirei]